MAKRQNHQRRCKECGHWHEASLKHCPECGAEQNKEVRAEVKKRLQVEDISVPVWRISPDDPLLMKIVKKPVQILQLILWAIIGFLVYLSTAFAH